MAISVYRSKIGGGFYVSLPLIVLVAVIWNYLQGSIFWTLVCISTIVILALVITASAIVYRRIYYTITENSIRIKSPHGVLDILFSKITSVDTEKDRESVYYGMSRDVVRIKFGTFSSVIISPNNKKGFLDELKTAGLNVK